MLKNLRRKAPEKEKLGHDLFKLAKTGEHGSPNKPSAIAYDAKLKLLAVGTQNGQLKVYGKPGVELIAQESSAATTCIQQLFFLEEQGRIISVCDDGEQNTLHLWEINNPYGQKSILEEVKACTLEGRLKKISVCCLSMARECLYIGTEGGHIYVLDLNSFELKDHVIYQDIVMQSLPGDTVKSNGGSVEALQEHPTDPEKLLIGYKKGIVVLWNQDKIKAEGPFITQQDVESVHWNSNSKQFISAHVHGNLAVWNVPEHDGEEPVAQESTPFGPFPCKAIRKVEWHDETVIFSGGLPRASYGDKHSVSILQENTVKVVLDFTSRVVDFFSILADADNSLSALVVLCEEEVVVIDLQTNSDKSFQVYPKPYLACIHSSNISSSTQVIDCPPDLWDFLENAGKSQAGDDLSTKVWPVTGGKCLLPNITRKDLLITGHEDGTVKFWNVSGLSFNLLYTISTGKLFQSDFDDGPPPDDGDDEDWPPFKKVGRFDPYADDPRFVIQKIMLCPVTRILVVGGSGGQLMIYDFKKAEEGLEPEMLDVNVIENLEGFEWKGHGPLTLRDEPISTQHGISPFKVIQLKPSAPITAVAMETAWGLITCGTCHGLVVFDYIVNKIVLTKCTVNPTDLANTGAGIQRKRTLAKSLRDSFRRLRSKRGSRRKKDPKGEGETSPSHGGVRSVGYEVAPEQRLIDESRVDEAVLSMVRCLYFGETFLGDGGHRAATLWAGTNAGYIYVFSIIIPESDRRQDTSIKTEVGKELKLKHHAPVINIFVVDKNGVPVTSVSEQEAGRTAKADMSGGHSVLISSEEQLKVFSLPTLRPRNKEKLTAVDGSRLRKLGIVDVPAKTPEGASVTHHCLVCLTNQGDALVYSVPFLKQQMKAKIMKREDIRAIQSSIFTRAGEGFYLKSPSELQRFSILASNKIKPDTVIQLRHGMRPDEDDRSDDEEFGSSIKSPVSGASVNSKITSSRQKKDGEAVTGVSFQRINSSLEHNPDEVEVS